MGPLVWFIGLLLLWIIVWAPVRLILGALLIRIQPPPGSCSSAPIRLGCSISSTASGVRAARLDRELEGRVNELLGAYRVRQGRSEDIRERSSS